MSVRAEGQRSPVSDRGPGGPAREHQDIVVVAPRRSRTEPNVALVEAAEALLVADGIASGSFSNAR